ncbi:MAG: NAD(+)/NADH kinase [Desulfurococcales archaeon]|nr:NAD(+)/NADH kinase [Desulfurococcales archaeon]
MKIGIYFKRFSRLASEVALKVAEECFKRKLEVYIEKTLVDQKEVENRDVVELVVKHSVGVFMLEDPEVDVVAVIGGDGTVLRAFHMLGNPRIPIMTIRMGRRGYLLDVTPIEIPDRIEDLARGRYKIVEYLRLGVKDLEISPPPALNEVAIVSIGIGRSKVVRLKIYKGDKPLYFMEGDGIIIATPIGSTAYSMAAGGPILDHNLKGFVVTPLAPVQTWLRPVVVDMNSKIRVSISEDSPEAYIIIDGQFTTKLQPGSSITVEKYPDPARVIRFHDIDSAYDRLFMRQ